MLGSVAASFASVKDRSVTRELPFFVVSDGDLAAHNVVECSDQKEQSEAAEKILKVHSDRRRWFPSETISSFTKSELNTSLIPTACLEKMDRTVSPMVQTSV